MLKQLSVRLEEDFIKNVKMLAIKQGIPVQEYVRLALVAYANEESAPIIPIVPEPEEAPTPTPTIEPEVPYEPLEPADFAYYYVLRKTVTLGKATKDDETKFNGLVLWSLPKGAKQHYDELGGMIPFRYTLGNEEYWPDEDELKILEEAYEKPVKIER